MRAIRHVFSWLLAILLIALFVQMSLHPLPDPAPGNVLLFDLPGDNILFATLAEKSGYPIFEPGIRVVTGFLLLFISGLIFLPWTRTAGGWLAVVLFVLGLIAHFSPWLGREIPVALGASELGLDNGRHFTLVLACLVGSTLLTIVHPQPKPK